ncbi:GrpB family protein [Spongiibacter sp. KMU-166]|uniref:GrpB family protein n=1 Tax=Spongiibacter thalassae TaxID=2721624 RepID=A0ABX1GJC7_9GAMM|nr:GrpB family protein [Spongiibacter thalassae]NKI18578.1 GrpB family protein [Spongiibacter thalassae]
MASIDVEIGLIGGAEMREVALCYYNPDWPGQYETEAVKIRRALRNHVLQIEHIGSTAVPLLAAKPIIDILLVIADPGVEAEYLPALLQTGYQLRVREPKDDQHRMLRTLARDVHIHIYPPWSGEVDRYLLFRDQLRASENDRIEYERTKRRLSQKVWADMNDYAAAKSEIVEAIIARRRADLLRNAT